MSLHTAAHSVNYSSCIGSDLLYCDPDAFCTTGGREGLKPTANPHSLRSSAIMRGVVCDTLNWIEANLDNDLHIVQLADRSGYTRWHFQRQFKEITGRSISEHVRIRRLVRAAEAIMYTAGRLMDIACDYGYTSQQAMSRVIRSAFGMTPTELRNRANAHHCTEEIKSDLDALKLRGLQ
ncbi:helix-turn-helix domain-containing protein [Erwinia sp. DT-104]|jgi:AraC-like DNA-binding protein|uniref:helix-turn-helix domain-containing protein n=1 Tax=Erwinia TaxID=551 RepID=UPI00263A5F1F|nr:MULTISPECIES: helix-turn-helix domain-containing protein [unclassified Erwinia]MDN4625961.1 helix-turn-helix domain-containing protein [Erwinia sp. PsM31]MDN8540356.1 helix-turn-helix domain-containing protein [Erwinia sp. BC051422]